MRLPLDREPAEIARPGDELVEVQSGQQRQGPSDPGARRQRPSGFAVQEPLVGDGGFVGAGEIFTTQFAGRSPAPVGTKRGDRFLAHAPTAGLSAQEILRVSAARFGRELTFLGDRLSTPKRDSSVISHLRAGQPPPNCRWQLTQVRSPHIINRFRRLGSRRRRLQNSSRRIKGGGFAARPDLAVLTDLSTRSQAQVFTPRITEQWNKQVNEPLAESSW
jgi:hypothetical protein